MVTGAHDACPSRSAATAFSINSDIGICVRFSASLFSAASLACSLGGSRCLQLTQ